MVRKLLNISTIIFSSQLQFIIFQQGLLKITIWSTIYKLVKLWLNVQSIL